MAQFIVRSVAHGGADPDRWRTGCTLNVDGCPVLVRSNLGNSSVDIMVSGPTQNRPIALGVVRTILNQINSANPEWGATGVVPLPDEPNLDVAYDHLVDLRDKEGAGWELRPEGTSRRYTVGELLGIVEPPQSAGNPPIPRDQDAGERLPSTADRVQVHAAIWALVGAALGFVYLLGQGDGLNAAEIATWAGLGGVGGGATGLMTGWLVRQFR